MSIEPEFIEKDPAERFPITFEWANALPSGYAITAVTGSAVDLSTGADATSDLLQSASGTYLGSMSTVEVKAGQTAGKSYKLVQTITTTPAGTFKESIEVPIRSK